MAKAELPQNEDLRLKNLYSFSILDSETGPEFQELLELASEISETPVSLITLIDKDRQWFIAKRGIELSETPREVAFCAHTILQDEVLLVENTLHDERFSDNPFVTDHLNVRFYVGAPIVSKEGYNLGTVCLIDTKPRELNEKQQRQLSLIAKQAARLIELHKRNNEVKKQSEIMLYRKTQSFRKLITDYEKSNSDMSTDLHEEVAQTIASSKYYLRAAQQDQLNAKSLLDTAINQLDSAIEEIRIISYKMTPPGIKLFTIGELIKELVSKIRNVFPFRITLDTHNTLEILSNDSTIVLLRTLYEWIDILNKKGNAGEIHIYLALDEGLILTITDSCASFDMDDRIKKIREEAIYDKIHAFDGTIDSEYEDGNFVFTISLPIIKSEAEV